MEVGGLAVALVETGSGGTMPVNTLGFNPEAADLLVAQGAASDAVPYTDMFDAGGTLLIEQGALTSVASGNISNGVDPYIAGDYSTDIQVPMLNVRYTHNINNFRFQIAGTYLSYDLEAASMPDVSIDCYSIQGGVRATFGPLRLSGAIYYAQNQEQMGFSGASNRDGFYLAPNGDVIDNDTIGWAVVANYKLNDMLEFQTGYGTLEHEWDSADAEADDKEAYYLQAKITVTKGFYIVPEIGLVDQKTTGTINKMVYPSVDEGDTFYVGAKFQMDF
jgi:hypothetical protein